MRRGLERLANRFGITTGRAAHEAAHREVDPAAAAIAFVSGLTGQPPGAISSSSAEVHARQNHWLYTCIRRVAQAPLRLPLRVYRQGEKGQVGHPELEAFLSGRHNPVVPGLMSWLYTFSWLKLRGDAFLFLDFGGGAGGLRSAAPASLRPLNWYCLPTNRVTIEDTPTQLVNTAAEYICHTAQGDPVRIHPSRIVHLHEWSSRGELQGTGAGEALTAELAMAQWATRWNVDGFKHGGSHRRWLFRLKGRFGSDEVAEETRRKLRRKFLGYDRAFEPILADADLDVTPIGQSHTDLEFPELLKMHREGVAAACGVPPARVGLLEHSNYANMTAQDRIFWESEILPLLAIVQSFLNTFVVPRFGPGIEVRFDTSDVAVLQDDVGEWIEWVAKLRQNTIITPNTGVKILRDHGLPSLPLLGPQGDRLIGPGSWVDIESLPDKPPDAKEPEGDESIDAFLEADDEKQEEAERELEYFWSSEGIAEGEAALEKLEREAAELGATIGGSNGNS